VLPCQLRHLLNISTSSDPIRGSWWVHVIPLKSLVKLMAIPYQFTLGLTANSPAKDGVSIQVKCKT
jgi:hypothetical protein